MLDQNQPEPSEIVRSGEMLKNRRMLDRLMHQHFPGKCARRQPDPKQQAEKPAPSEPANGNRPRRARSFRINVQRLEIMAQSAAPFHGRQQIHRILTQRKTPTLSTPGAPRRVMAAPQSLSQPA